MNYKEINGVKTYAPQSRQELITHAFASKSILVAINAEKILKGEISLSGYPTKNITIPFNADDIDKGLPGWQLAVASLKIPDILLNAFIASGKKEFLTIWRLKNIKVGSSNELYSFLKGAGIKGKKAKECCKGCEPLNNICNCLCLYGVVDKDKGCK